MPTYHSWFDIVFRKCHVPHIYWPKQYIVIVASDMLVRIGIYPHFSLTLTHSF